ncbi:hypothetical protein, partial [Limnohabitans sp.]|uniref:hypothetical protein n=1 Tax=Limnohabitans sp. TaxID=1907725 RepID=UPI00311E7915
RVQSPLVILTKHGLLRFENEDRTLFLESEQIHLTPQEAIVVRLLFERYRTFAHQDEIFRALCGQGKKYHTAGIVALYAHRINKKIRPYGLCVSYLRGYGYRLQIQTSASYSPSIENWLRTPVRFSPSTARLANPEFIDSYVKSAGARCHSPHAPRAETQLVSDVARTHEGP